MCACVHARACYVHVNVMRMLSTCVLRNLDTDYKCSVKMPASEFQRICKDLSILGDTVTIAVGKEGVKFSCAHAKTRSDALGSLCCHMTSQAYFIIQGSRVYLTIDMSGHRRLQCAG